jgi:hypothetical protein
MAKKSRSRAIQASAKKNLAKAKLHFARVKVKAKRELARMSVILKRHQSAIKVAAKRYQAELKKQKRPA